MLILFGCGYAALGQFSFAYGNPGGNANNQATTVTVDIHGSNLTLADFEHLSTNPPGDTQAFFAAAFARTGVATVRSSRATWEPSARSRASPSPRPC